MRPRLGRSTLAVLAIVTLTGTVAAEGAPPGSFTGSSSLTGERDARVGAVAPTAVQLAEAAGAGIHARWNRYGTPQMLTPARPGGALASGLGADAVTAARTYIQQNRDLLGLAPGAEAQLQLISNAPIGTGRALLFRQSFGGVPAAPDGLLMMGVVDGKVISVASSLTRDASLSGTARLSPEQAYVAAANDLGLSLAASDVRTVSTTGAQVNLRVAGIDQPQTAKLVAIPTPTSGVHLGYQVLVYANGATDPVAALSFVDAQTGQVLDSQSIVDYETDDPVWAAFQVSPPLDYSSTDTRQRWCFFGTAASCALVVGNPASPLAWDVDPATGTTTQTTRGNNEIAVQNWFNNNPRSVGTETATPSPTRDYTYPWTNQWNTQRCNPNTTFTSPAANDIDAARANLHAMHNRMHDFAYNLGFTETTFNLQLSNFGRGGAENDYEQGNAQAGGVTGGPPGFAARDNANQITPPDGVPPITNMYLWQPIAGSFYSPCVDGDYDMTVIGHEYTHAISNRMVGGPDLGIGGFQGGSMGESWSDLDVEEYLHENGYVPIAGENPWAVGPYVTGDLKAGIRNYPLDANPLNFADIGYDVTGAEVHADGEVWSAVNYAVRQAMVAKYDRTFPSGDAALQRSCAAGATPVDQCPGNRRWIQLMYDAWLLMPQAPSMVDARDAMLAADVARFGGANQDALWKGFAATGLGSGAASLGGNDTDPTPSFASPLAGNAQVTFAPVTTDGTPISGAQVFVGRYTARVTPVADTDPVTTLTDTASFEPGSYDVIVTAPGFGAASTVLNVKAGAVVTRSITLRENLASAANGATATGDGVNQAQLIDDNEGTDWASLNAPVAGKQVTVQLDPSHTSWQVSRVQVSALVHPANPADPNDPGGQSRFSALRQFQIQTCLVSKKVDCSTPDQFQTIFTSPTNAFPAVAPRPRAPDLALRSFSVPKTKATYVRLVVLTNQCTGTPAYAGDQDDDPGNSTDCTTASVQALNVRAAELQVFQK